MTFNPYQLDAATDYDIVFWFKLLLGPDSVLKLLIPSSPSLKSMSKIVRSVKRSWFQSKIGLCFYELFMYGNVYPDPEINSSLQF